jgi:hypothetical protein
MRNREQLAAPPINLSLDESAIEFIGKMISRWAIGGLGGTF